jgi:hypothetical protein
VAVSKLYCLVPRRFGLFKLRKKATQAGIEQHIASGYKAVNYLYIGERSLFKREGGGRGSEEKCLSC